MLLGAILVDHRPDRGGHAAATDEGAQRAWPRSWKARAFSTTAPAWPCSPRSWPRSSAAPRPFGDAGLRFVEITVGGTVIGLAVGFLGLALLRFAEMRRWKYLRRSSSRTGATSPPTSSTHPASSPWWSPASWSRDIGTDDRKPPRSPAARLLEPARVRSQRDALHPRRSGAARLAAGAGRRAGLADLPDHAGDSSGARLRTARRGSAAAPAHPVGLAPPDGLGRACAARSRSRWRCPSPRSRGWTAACRLSPMASSCCRCWCRAG